MRALRAISAVLRATAGLDRKQGRELNLVRIEVPAMRKLCPKNKLRQRQIEEPSDLPARPIVPHGIVSKRIRHQLRPIR
jgi:hypothetical protein